MAETSLPWGGTVTGDAGPYTDDQWSDVWRKLFTRDRTVEGVLPDYLNELAVTNPAGLTIRVASGGAVVDGKFYDSSANEDFAGAAPGGGSNFYNVVLRKSFAGQTVRLAMLGPNAVSPDAPTQSDGVTWEISIATVEITSGSTVTITDAREYCHFNMEIETAMIPADAITTPKLLDGAVTAAKMTDGASSGVDADLLDGQEGSYYMNSITTLSATSDITLSVTETVIPGMTGSFGDGQYLVIATVNLKISGSAGQMANINLRCRLDAVVQGGHAHEQHDIPASANDVNINMVQAWRVSVTSGPKTIDITAYTGGGSTATVDTLWQIDKAQVIRISD